MEKIFKFIEVSTIMIVILMAIGFVFAIITIANGNLVSKKQLTDCQKTYSECVNDKNYFKDVSNDFQIKTDACKLELGSVQGELNDYKEAFTNVYPMVAEYDEY